MKRALCQTTRKQIEVLFAPVFLAVCVDSCEAEPLEAKVEPGMMKTYHRVDWDESDSLRDIQYMVEKPGIQLLPSGKEHHRFIRRASACELPKNLTTSRLDCMIYDKRISCRETCIFGYTFEEGIQREVKCQFKQDTWSPKLDSEKCKPFVDCTLSLDSAGELKCNTHFMHKGSTCEVSCAHYEDKLPTPKTTYVCDIKGKWKPELPHCASVGTDQELEPVPKGPKTIAEIKLLTFPALFTTRKHPLLSENL